MSKTLVTSETRYIIRNAESKYYLVIFTRLLDLIWFYCKGKE